MKCKTCKWFKDGVCHKYPPMVIATSGDNAYLVASTEWPVVYETDFCGEYEPRIEQESDLGD